MLSIIRIVLSYLKDKGEDSGKATISQALTSHSNYIKSYLKQKIRADIVDPIEIDNQLGTLTKKLDGDDRFDFVEALSDKFRTNKFPQDGDESEKADSWESGAGPKLLDTLISNAENILNSKGLADSSEEAQSYAEKIVSRGSMSEEDRSRLDKIKSELIKIAASFIFQTLANAYKNYSRKYQTKEEPIEDHPELMNTDDEIIDIEGVANWIKRMEDPNRDLYTDIFNSTISGEGSEGYLSTKEIAKKYNVSDRWVTESRSKLLDMIQKEFLSGIKKKEQMSTKETVKEFSKLDPHQQQELKNYLESHIKKDAIRARVLSIFDLLLKDKNQSQISQELGLDIKALNDDIKDKILPNYAEWVKQTMMKKYEKSARLKKAMDEHCIELIRNAITRIKLSCCILLGADDPVKDLYKGIDFDKLENFLKQKTKKDIKDFKKPEKGPSQPEKEVQPDPEDTKKKKDMDPIELILEKKDEYKEKLQKYFLKEIFRKKNYLITIHFTSDYYYEDVSSGKKDPSTKPAGEDAKFGYTTWTLSVAKERSFGKSSISYEYQFSQPLNRDGSPNGAYTSKLKVVNLSTGKPMVDETGHHGEGFFRSFIDDYAEDIFKEQGVIPELGKDFSAIYINSKDQRKIRGTTNFAKAIRGGVGFPDKPHKDRFEKMLGLKQKVEEKRYSPPEEVSNKGIDIGRVETKLKSILNKGLSSEDMDLFQKYLEQIKDVKKKDEKDQKEFLDMVIKDIHKFDQKVREEIQKQRKKEAI